MHRWIIYILALASLVACATLQENSNSKEQLLRESYVSQINHNKREYFVYLPRGYEQQPDKKWPVMLFLHGNGERGNGLDELDYVMTHGALYEAWVQKKALPFIIIAPQLPMFGMDQKGIDYIDNRSKNNIPQRQENGTPAREALYSSAQRMTGSTESTTLPPLPPAGWEKVERDLIGMIDSVIDKYRSDSSRIYLSGLSYGGFGTWYLASQYPHKFAAIAPVVGWGHPDFMPAIAKAHLPVWAFAGGRDNAVPVQYFYPGINKLEELGSHPRFTTHEDMGHDTWKRVYAGDDLYNWLLQHHRVD